MGQPTEKPQTPKKVTVNYDEIDAVVLTEEETIAAIRKVKEHKLAKIREKEYWDRIRKPVEFPTYKTPQDFGKLIINKIKHSIPGFVIDDQNRDIFKLLCLYFTRDPEFENSEDFSLDKGMALIGPVGCGKTTLLHGFNINPYNSYVQVSCRTVAGDYSKLGEDAINFYSAGKIVSPNDYWGQSNVGYFFDDLGTEPTTKKHFGNVISVMEEIILNRYDVPALKGKTHLTSNLSADDIGEVYGTRVRSRMREMMNWIEFDITVKDRRK